MGRLSDITLPRATPWPKSTNTTLHCYITLLQLKDLHLVTLNSFISECWVKHQKLNAFIYCGLVKTTEILYVLSPYHIIF